MKIKVPDGTLRKTISIGVSEFPKDTEGFWQGIKFADVALYKAKETGRNKVVRFTQDMWTTDDF
jgi:diguanylate cyclase (GGDEF)-like protein